MKTTQRIPVQIDLTNLAWLNEQDESIARIVNTLITEKRTESAANQKGNNDESIRSNKA